MKPEVLLELLEGVADQLEVKVSYETLQTSGLSQWHGGLCRVKGTYRIIVDKRATAEERANTLATALATFDTSELELSQKLRDLLKLHETTGSTKHRRTAA
ncbi:MAG: hypothetical protein H0T42_33140 [Deltaproteobacteria bacterium]|nr:hypothetical protein [Deltaproteobacteria bacterium]